MTAINSKAPQEGIALITNFLVNLESCVSCTGSLCIFIFASLCIFELLHDVSLKHYCIFLVPYIQTGGRVGNMLAWHAVNPGSIPGRGDTW